MFKLGAKTGFSKTMSLKSKFNKDTDASVPGTPVIRKSDLAPGVAAEANNDGSIFISDKVKPGSDFEKRVLIHEMKHINDMKFGKLEYSDDHLKWEGTSYERKDGKINYNGKWIPEGSKDFPWERH
tara:strand:+ start:1090 stop:1467 length:378 start_codon:yes stop_codon:yes gene_type:complete